VNNHPKRARRLGIAFFSLGILIGAVFFSLLSWAKMEAFFYFDYVQAEKTLTTLSCPFILTNRQEGLVTVTYNNPNNQTVSPQVMVEISTPALFRSISLTPAFTARETKRLQWTVSRQDVVFGSLTLVEVYVGPVNGAPDRNGTCGILWVDLPMLTGTEVFYGALAGSLLFLALGWWLWIYGRGPRQARGAEVMRTLLALTAAVLLGMVASILGSWLLGVICLALCVLLVVSALGTLAQRM
jgi:hypothetical protein